ncbi:MAG: MobV family relaxase [Lachnospiraceae bacterium]|nr:MobV family relaxase [Lachnospiraceae bacterium]
MGYCFMTTQKIKSLGTLASKDNHNNRKVDVPNADPDLYEKNDNYFYTTDDEGNKLDYVEAWKERMNDIPKFRSDAVRAIEVLMTFSREENIDIETWKEKNLEWLQKTFDVAPDGKSNILDVIYHADEPGNVHCHAIVVPIDERGKLNASRFLDGRAALTQMQSDYAKDMKEFGLERGLENGQASHKEIRKFYAELNNAINNVPEPKPEESAVEYRNRALEELQTLQAAAKRERDRKAQETERRLAEKRIKQEKYFKEQWKELKTQKSSIIEEAKAENSSLFESIKEQQQILERTNDDLSVLKCKYQDTKNKYEKIENRLEEATNVEKKVQFFDTLQQQFSLLYKMDSERAEKFAQELSYIENLKDEQLKENDLVLEK